MNGRGPAARLADAARLCARQGLRLTSRRRLVLETLYRRDRPMTAYELLDALREPLANPAPPTVYRALDFLVAAGLVHRLESVHAFVACHQPDERHHGQFLICHACGDAHEVSARELTAGLREVGASSGFTVERPMIEAIGTCGRCAARKPAS